MKNVLFCAGMSALLLSSCGNKQSQPAPKADDGTVMGFARVELKTDLSRFSDTDKKMMAYLCDAAELMDQIYWKQAFTGDKDAFLKGIQNDTLRRFAEINYGPWDRLNGNQPFIEGYGQKPLGANFYPADMTKEEFDAALEVLRGLPEASEGVPGLAYSMKRSDGNYLYFARISSSGTAMSAGRKLNGRLMKYQRFFVT